MNWFDLHAPAIQALASVATLLVTVALAGLTAWYVKVTRSIAAAAGDQVRLLKSQSVEARKQTAASLVALVRRLQASLAQFDVNSPKHVQLLEYAQLSQEDLSRLEELAASVSDNAIRYGGKAVVSLRKVAAIMSDAQKANKITGWLPSDAQLDQWRTAMDAAPKMLALLEQEAQSVAA